MQDLSDPANSILSQKVPDSGTAGRGLLALGGTALVAGQFNPYLAAGIGAAALPYSSIGQKAVQGLLTQRPELSRLAGKAITNNAASLGLLTVPSFQPLMDSYFK